MAKLQTSQEEIFDNYGWWDKNGLLLQITQERLDYIESRVDRVFGKGALRQQEILEVGCGGGLLCDGLAQRGAMVVGIDPSQRALETARLHTQESGVGQIAYFEHGYAESLPHADGSFSVIICLDTLEHVNDLQATIKEIARVLAPGGVFIFDTINRTLMSRVVLLWIGEHLSGNGLPSGIHTYHKFIKPDELRALLVEQGLTIGEITGFMPRGFKNGRLILGPGWFKGVSYIGYATK